MAPTFVQINSPYVGYILASFFSQHPIAFLRDFQEKIVYKRPLIGCWSNSGHPILIFVNQSALIKNFTQLSFQKFSKKKIHRLETQNSEPKQNISKNFPKFFRAQKC